MNEKKKLNINDLPEEILGTCLEFLPTKNIFLLRRVSKFFHSAICHTQHSISVNDLKHIEPFINSIQKLNFLDVLILRNSKFGDKELERILPKISSTLKHIELISSKTISTLSLKKFLKLQTIKVTKSKNLHVIDIQGCPNLEEIRISQSSFYNVTSLLENLLKTKSTSKITKISFSRCVNIKEKFVFPKKLEEGVFDRMVFLDLSYSKIFSIILHGIVKNFANLKELVLDHCHMLKNSKIENHKSLKNLSMKHCNELKNFKIISCNALEEIDFSKNSISSRDFLNILTFNVNLVRVNISECFNVDEASISKDVDKQNNLKELNCNFTPFEDESVKRILNYSPLIEVLLLKQTTIQDVQIISNSLKVVDVSGTYLNMENIAFIAKNCPKLVNINLSACFRISKDLEFKSNSLEILRIRSTMITGETVCRIIKSCKSLKSVDVSYNASIRDLDIVLKEGEGEKLKFLDVGNLNSLRKAVLKMKNLEQLNLSHDIQLDKFTFDLPNLKIVNVVKCTERVTSYLTEGNKNLKVFGAERSLEKTLTYQEENFAWCQKNPNYWSRMNQLKTTTYNKEKRELYDKYHKK